MPNQSRFSHLSISVQSPATASAGVMRGTFHEEPSRGHSSPKKKSPDEQWQCKIKLKAIDLHGCKLRRPSATGR